MTIVAFASAVTGEDMPAMTIFGPSRHVALKGLSVAFGK